MEDSYVNEEIFYILCFVIPSGQTYNLYIWLIDYTHQTINPAGSI